METLVNNIELPNGFCISLSDSTRRYYEDYHLVRLRFVCRVPLQAEYFDCPETFAEAKRLLGDSAVYSRTCEKMGVPFSHIEVARDRMVSDFMNNVLPYFSHETFPRKLVLSELAKARENAVRSRI